MRTWQSIAGGILVAILDRPAWLIDQASLTCDVMQTLRDCRRKCWGSAFTLTEAIPTD